MITRVGAGSGQPARRLELSARGGEFFGRHPSGLVFAGCLLRADAGPDSLYDLSQSQMALQRFFENLVLVPAGTGGGNFGRAQQ